MIWRNERMTCLRDINQHNFGISGTKVVLRCRTKLQFDVKINCAAAKSHLYPNSFHYYSFSVVLRLLLYEEKYLLLQISWYRQTEVALVWLGLVVTGVPEIRSGQTIITHNCLMSFKRMRALC